jgi:DNA-binding NarL/FixJ family response regulator
MTAPPLRVLIAEDNEDLRALLVTLVSAEPDLRCVGTAADVEAVIASTVENKADVLVLDLELQGRSSIDLLRSVRRNGSKISIVVCSPVIRTRK